MTELSRAAGGLTLELPRLREREGRTVENLTPDTWNEPQPVHIDGQVFMMREITAISLRAHLRDFFAIGGRVAGKKEIVEALRGGNSVGKEAAYAEIFAGTIDGYADEVFAVLQEATGIPTEVIGRMPMSMLFGLLDAFIQLHDKSLRRFFAVRRRWEGIVGDWRGVPGTAPQGSSLASSEEDSATASAAS